MKVKEKSLSCSDDEVENVRGEILQLQSFRHNSALFWGFLSVPTGTLFVLKFFQYFHFSKRPPCLSTLSQLQSFWPKLISSQSFVCSELLLEGSSALKETRQLIFFFQLGKTTRKRVLSIFSLPKIYIQHHLEKLILHPPKSSILHIPRNIYPLAQNTHWTYSMAAGSQ